MIQSMPQVLKRPTKISTLPKKLKSVKSFSTSPKSHHFSTFPKSLLLQKKLEIFSFLSVFRIRSEVSSAKAETHHRKVKYQPCLGVVPCNPQLMLISWRCWGSPGSKNSKKLQYLLSSRKTVLKLLNVCFAANPFQFSKEDTMASIVFFLQLQNAWIRPSSDVSCSDPYTLWKLTAGTQ